MGRKTITIGTRDSELALWQTNHVHSILTKAHPEFEFKIASTSSLGDDVQDKALVDIAKANPGLFTKSLEVGLLSRKYDIGECLLPLPSL